MTRKAALITDISGQHGAYLARLLLKKGCEVHGIKRRASLLTTEGVDELYEPHESETSFFPHYGDMTVVTNLVHQQSAQPKSTTSARKAMCK